MLSDKWAKFSLVVLILFCILFLYGLSVPGIRANIGITSTVTTFIGLFYFGFFIFKQIKQNKISESNPILKDKRFRAGIVFIKVCVVSVALIIVYLVYLLLINK